MRRQLTDIELIKYRRSYNLSNRFFEIRDGKVVLLDGFADRNLNPVWAGQIRRAQKLGIGIPMLVMINGKFLFNVKVGILGTFSD